MKALKIIGVIILILIAIFLIVPLFLANQVTISESTVINAKPVTVFNQVITTSNWSNWSPFHKADTAMIAEYTGPTKGIGSTMTWQSKTMGDGSLVVAESKPYSYIKNNITFTPDEGGAIGEWTFQPQEDGLLVTWKTTIIGLDYPMGRYMGIMAKTMMKPFMISGLMDLKAVCEALPVPADISIIEIENVPSLSIMDSTTVEGIGDMFEKDYQLIMDYMKAKKIEMAGVPYAVYYNWDPSGIIRIRAAIPVSGVVKGKGNIEFFDLPATKAVFAKHFGGYDTSATHDDIMNYMSDFGIECDDYVWEVYVTDPETEPDESKWETDIYYPVK
ncbi:MAG: SRPBCC family protein [Bacteroidales bacterium]|nr:SRPBCC family protein [Bacteroidales bacterium]